MKGEREELNRQYMNHALLLASSSEGQTSPNPMVGAVVVHDHQVVGMGAHLRAGEAHAEVIALDMAREKAQGATLYVTLEPCSHYGRTPPCAQKVIEAGIKKVFIATLDPNPLVAGRGAQMLTEAGVEVAVGLLAEECQKLNEAYNYYIVHQRPFVTLKTATTLDGKIATVTGASKWITGQEARADVHQLRHRHDAILVGINTVIHDNPRLTTRFHDDQQGSHPIRVVLDSTLRIPLDTEIVDTTEAPTWIFTSQQADPERIERLQEYGVRIFKTTDQQQVSIEHVLKILGEQQVLSLLVEGGGEVNASFLQNDWVHKVIAYIAPKLIGGNQAPGPFRGKGFENMNEVLRLQETSFEPLGQDIKVIGYLK